MGACASKPKTVEGKAPQEEVPAQQTPKVAPDTTTAVSADQVASPDQTTEKVVVEEAKEEPAALVVLEAAPTADGEKAEAGTSELRAIDNKETEVIQEKIVVEEKEKPSASPTVVEEATTAPSIVQEETTATSVVEKETIVPAVAEEKPMAANVVLEVVEDNTKEAIVKNATDESEGEEKLATQQS